MTLISYSPLQDGVTGVNASATNTPLSTIYNDYNGNITDANISASAAIAFSKISGGSSSGLSASQAWTPTWTNLIVTSSTVVAKYIQIGKKVFYRVSVVLAGTNAPTGAVQFTLPVTSVSYAGVSTVPPMGMAVFNDSSVTIYQGVVGWVDTTHGVILVNNASATYLTQSNISSTVPFTFGVGDEIHLYGDYEAA